MPIDHGLALGEVEGLLDALTLLGTYLTLPLDGIFSTKSMYVVSGPLWEGRRAPARIMTADTFFTGPTELLYSVIVDPEVALRHGFDAMTVILLWDQPSGARMHAVRGAFEMGADILKIPFPGSSE